MGALAAHLSGGLDIKQGTKVTSLSRDSGGTWSILATGPDGNAVPPLLADALVVTLPAAQSALLLGAVDSEWSRVAASAKQTPCWAVMLTTRGVGDLGGDVFEDAQGPIAWTCREASKPGRAGAVQDGESGVGEERWLLHASAAWSEAHLDAAPELVAQALSEAFLLQHGALVRAEHAARRMRRLGEWLARRGCAHERRCCGWAAARRGERARGAVGAERRGRR
jgi:hypothetical protein